MQTTATVPNTLPSSSAILLSSTWSEDYLDIIFNGFLGQLFPYQGLLLLDETGQLMYSTPKARELCQVLQSDCILTPPSGSNHEEITLPHLVTRQYELLIDSRLEFPEHLFQLNEDVFLEPGVRINLNIEWISLQEDCPPCILVRLEDITQIAQKRATWAAHRYRLTSREKEVWTLYLQGLSYHEIGKRLFISRNTVSKHMKSVYSKRRDTVGNLDMQD